MENSTKKIIFIVGSGRSGTTMLRNIFRMHPQAGVIPELKFFSLFWSMRKKFGKMKKNNKMAVDRVIRIIKNKVKDPLLKEVGVDFGALRSKLLECATYRQLLFVLGQQINTNPRAQLIVYKTPSDIFYLKKITTWFPEAKIIHVVRDGREVCASAKGRGWGRNIYDLALKWKEPVRVFDKFLAKNNFLKNKIIEVKLEDLVEGTKETLKMVFRFSGLAEPDDQFINNLNDLPSNSSFAKEKKSGIYKSRNFTTVFNLEEQKILGQLMRPELAKHGYNIEKKGINFIHFIRLYLAQLRTSIGRCLSQFGRYHWLYKLKIKNGKSRSKRKI